MRGTLQVRPCKLGRRIHAAHAPSTGPTPPSTVSCDLSNGSWGISISERFHPRMAWIYCRSRRSVEGGALWVCGV
ncbi:hypothetical protein FEO87_08425 [Stenotrophomonas maltophilia]|nr:hypothetical protein FEO87_08425 [Stenotrophomonas maltophilia]